MFFIILLIVFQKDFNIIKKVWFKLSFLKKWVNYNLNIYDAIFLKNKCIISIGNNLENLIDNNLNKIFFSFIFKIK